MSECIERGCIDRWWRSVVSLKSFAYHRSSLTSKYVCTDSHTSQRRIPWPANLSGLLTAVACPYLTSIGPFFFASVLPPSPVHMYVPHARSMNREAVARRSSAVPGAATWCERSRQQVTPKARINLNPQRAILCLVLGPNQPPLPQPTAVSCLSVRVRRPWGCTLASVFCCCSSVVFVCRRRRRRSPFLPKSSPAPHPSSHALSCNINHVRTSYAPQAPACGRSPASRSPNTRVASGGGCGRRATR